MDLTHWYAVSIAIIVALLLIYRIGLVSCAFLVAQFRLVVLKLLVYPMFVKRRYWVGVSRFHASLVGVYFVINGFCMGLGIRSTSELIVRSGTMASINMIPLFFGGRTSILADFLGVSLHTYYLAHHWIGRVVILQGLLHVALVLASGKPWTFDSSQISGISSISALALILFFSVWFMRKFMFEFFLKLHFILAIVTLVTLLTHLFPLGFSRTVYPIAAISLWVINAILRLARILYYNSGSSNPQRADLTHFKNSGQVSASEITVHLHKSMRIRPGQYVYLFFTEMGLRRRISAHPYAITWWDDSMKATTLSFLIQTQNGISLDLTTRSSLRNVIIDGPYGRDLQLERYETVILIAKGIGIAGILPYARHMTYRRASKDKDHEAYRRGLITRKLDVFWILDDNSQQDWLSGWLSQLQSKDSEKLLLTFSCLYPEKRSKPPPFASDPHWRFIYELQPIPIIESLITKQIQRSPGKTIVTACGTADFSASIRKMALKAMGSFNNVTFVETEYQPQAATGRQIVERHGEGIELGAKSGAVSKIPTLRRDHGKSRQQAIDDKQHLVQSHSGISDRLKTWDEEDESILNGGTNKGLGEEVRAKEIV